MDIRPIAIASIEVGERLRALDPVWVDLLAEEIAQDGQAEAVRVVALGDVFLLIDGARRIAALAKLGAATVEARIEPEEALADAAFVRLGEIKGNLMRGELTMLDRALYVAAWRDAYQSVRAVRKRGRPTNAAVAEKITAQRAEIKIRGIAAANEDRKDLFVHSLSEAARQVLGISDRTLSRLLSIASIGAACARRLVGHPSADNRTELLLLAEQPGDRQVAVIDLLTGEEPKAATVAEAIDILDGKTAPTPPAPYERVHQSLSRLSEDGRTALFELNREEIERWLAASATKATRKPKLRAVH